MLQGLVLLWRCVSIYTIVDAVPMPFWLLPLLWVLLGTQCNTTPFRNSSHIRNITNSRVPIIVLCTIAKQEDQYIQEWVDYNVKIGFEYIYIYDNNDYENSTSPSLGNITKTMPAVYPGIVTVIPYEGHRPRPLVTAYTEFAQQMQDQDVYAAFFDVDEFLVMGNYTCIRDLLQAYAFEGRKSLAIPWVHFGSEGHLNYTALPLTQRFQHRARLANQFVKQILYCPDVVNFHTAHHAILKNGKEVHDLLGYPLNVGRPMVRNFTEIAVFHYAVKSLQEYEHKMQRGSSSTGTHTMQYFRHINNISTEFDDRAHRTALSHKAYTCGVLQARTV